MATALLSPHNSLSNPQHLHFFGSLPLPAGKKPVRSPLPPNKPLRSPPSNRKTSKSVSNKSNPTRPKNQPRSLLPGDLIILKRGEDLKSLSAVRSKSNDSDLCSKAESETKIAQTNSDLKKEFSGPVCVTSPPASDVPIPSFCMNKKTMADGLKNLLKL